jgi:response regulator RpfG family c-di-GMP phosphodiesterase
MSAMGILVVEDNFLVGQMIRLAVEDAELTVLGPYPTVEQGMRVAHDGTVDGALLDIKVSGDHVFPLARLLHTKRVPVIFVSGYDRSVVPDDLSAVPLIPKPVSVERLTRLAAEKFSGAASSRVTGKERAETLRSRVADAERRVETQKRRLERLLVRGDDARPINIVADLLEQMKISAELMREAVRAIEHPERAVGSFISRPICDELIDPDDPAIVGDWASRLGTTSERLLQLGEQYDWHARLVAKALNQGNMSGPPRRSST